MAYVDHNIEDKFPVIELEQTFRVPNTKWKRVVSQYCTFDVISVYYEPLTGRALKELESLCKDGLWRFAADRHVPQSWLYLCNFPTFSGESFDQVGNGFKMVSASFSDCDSDIAAVFGLSLVSMNVAHYLLCRPLLPFRPLSVAATPRLHLDERDRAVSKWPEVRLKDSDIAMPKVVG